MARRRRPAASGRVWIRSSTGGAVFAVVMTFDENPEDRKAGIEHVKDEVLPALADADGLQGWWLVDPEAGRRITVMVWGSEADLDAGMKAVQEARATDP